MRRSAAVVGLTLLAALALGLHTAAQDIDEEQEGALALAGTLLRVQTLSGLDDTTALAAIHEIGRSGHQLRHLRLEVSDAAGRSLMQPARDEAPPPQPAPSALARMGESVRQVALDLHRRFFPMPAPAPLVQTLTRPDGTQWSLTLHASPESERLEALSGLLDQLGVLCAMGIGLLWMLRINLRHALGPVATLLTGIGQLEKQDTQALRDLPTMPVQELEQIAGALRHLAHSLEQAESRRRILAHQLSELQETERQRIASDLHDELGQHLTALRLDLSWLQRRLESAPVSSADWLAPVLGVAGDMTEHCRALQQDLRNLLTRLRPFGHETAPASEDQHRIELGELRELIQALVDSWRTSRRDNTFDIDWQINLVDPVGVPLDPTGVSLERGQTLALFRLTQEALTNIARHAGATRARLRIKVTSGPTPNTADATTWHASKTIDWCCEDDGVGLLAHDFDESTAALHRGNGLNGMQERVWLLGGRWHVSHSPDLGGLQLSARMTEATAGFSAPPIRSSAPPPGRHRKSAPAPS